MVEALLGPLDHWRARLLKACGPPLRPFIVDRSLRVSLTGSLIITAAFCACLVLPLWMLALGPIVWGIPHVLADVRYLVVKPGHHKRRVLWLAVGLPLLAAALGGGVVAGLSGAAGALLAARCAWTRKAAGLAVVSVMAGLALWAGPVADIVFAHAHNFIAVALWWAWRPRSGRSLHWWPLVLFLGGTAALCLGVADTLAVGTLSMSWALDGMDGAWFAGQLAPGLSTQWSLRLVILFAFAQAVHYGMWVRMVPEDDRPQSTPRSFKASWSALKADFGGWPMGLVLVGCVALAVWAVADLAGARLGYLRMAIFHGHLELAAAALLFAEGRPR